MDIFGRLSRRFLAWLRSARLDRETDEEIRFHLEMEAAKLAALGRAPGAARHQATSAFGSALRTREEVRDAHGLAWWDDLRADVRIAVRSLRRMPAFHLILIATVGLGASLATVIIGTADAVLLRPLPYVDSERTVAVWAESDRGGTGPITVDGWHGWASIGGLFEAFAAYDQRGIDYTGPDGTETLASAQVTKDFFAVLTVPAMKGRVIGPEDSGRDNVAVVGARFWRRRLGGDPGVIGKSVLLDGRYRTIVGVLPADFGFPRRDIEVWVPMSEESSDRYVVWMVARLSRSADDTQRELRVRATSLGPGVPKLRLTPVGPKVNGDIRLGFEVLVAGALAVLLIAAVNAANLLLFRGLTRRREFATRLALGAGRFRLVRQLMTESFVVGSITAIVVLVSSWVGLRVVSTAIPTAYTWFSFHDIEAGRRVVAGAVIGTIMLGLGLGIWPALRAANTEAGLARAGHSAALGARRGRSALVVIELALSTGLLVGAGLLVHSSINLNRVHLGLDADHLSVLELSLRHGSLPDSASRATFERRLVDDLRAIPGVTDLTVTDGLAPRTAMGFPDSVIVEGPESRYTSIGMINQADVDTSYFRVVGTPIVLGRGFTAADYLSGDNPVVIDPDLSARLWPGQSAIGRRLRLSPRSPWLRVVGIAADAKLGGQDDRALNYELYYPRPPGASTVLAIAIRTVERPADLVRPVQLLLRRLDPSLPIWANRPMRAGFDEVLAKPKFLTGLVTWFAGVGLALGLVGLFGVLSLAVARRTREIGLRMAIGASSGQVVGLVVRQSIAVMAAGVGLGLGMGLLAARMTAPLLYRLDPLDRVTFATVPVLVLAAGLVATAVPARRAARIAPMEALRVD